MLLSNIKDLDILVCPNCRWPLDPTDARITCSNADCPLCRESFLTTDDKLVLVDFSSSILNKALFLESQGASPIRRNGRLRKKLNSIANGENRIAAYFAHKTIEELEHAARQERRRPRVLVIGGGAIGSGAEGLYSSSQVDVVAFDIYASDNVTFIADGHFIPLTDDSIDAVWIQAVLEHVVDPAAVVAEICRVLRPNGLLFSDIPFLWPVHEKGFDYTRFTASGQRWLFRNFDVLAAGTSSGPGTSFLLALRHLVCSLTRSAIMAHLVCLPFIWIRRLDYVCDLRRGVDAAAGLFFYGRKSRTPINHDGLVAFYDEQPRLQAQVPQYLKSRWSSWGRGNRGRDKDRAIPCPT